MIEDLIRRVLKVPPGTKKINEDLAYMRTMMGPVLAELIPFQEENELELLSLRHEIKNQKQGLDKIWYGSISSIYYEPMVAFCYKDYIKGVRDALLLCRTRNMEFIYRIRKGSTEVYFNGAQAAVIDANGVMIGVKSRQVLARVKPYSKELMTITVKEKEAGQLYNPLQPHAPQQRAYSLLRSLQDEDETIFLGITFYELMVRMLANKMS
jgi:hypothetical protein